MDNIKKVIIAILIINIGVVLYFGVSIKRDIDLMKTEYSSIHTNLMNQVIMQGNNISSSVASSISESRSDLKYHSFNVESTDYESDQAMVSFYVTLKQASGDGQIVAVFTGLETGKVYSFELASIGNLNYETQFNIPIGENYAVEVYEQINDGSKRLLHDQSIPFLIYNDYYASRVQSFGSGTSANDEGVTIHHEFMLNRGSQDVENIRKILVQAFGQNHEVIAEYDVTDKLIVKASSPDVQAKYQTVLAAGVITNEMSIEEFREEFGIVSSYGQEPQTYLFVEETLNRNILGDILDMHIKGDIYFAIQIHFEDGMILDL